MKSKMLSKRELLASYIGVNVLPTLSKPYTKIKSSYMNVLIDGQVVLWFLSPENV